MVRSGRHGRAPGSAPLSDSRPCDTPLVLSEVCSDEILAGEVGLVTGGASGIGRATAERFAAEDMRVCVVDFDEDGGRAVADSVGGLFVAADVGDAGQVDAAFARCADELGGVGVAYLNVGIAIGHPDIATLPDEVYRRIMRVNVDGVVFGARRRPAHATGWPRGDRGDGVARRADPVPTRPDL